MSSIKVIEVMAESKKSWEDAVAVAVKDVSKTIKDIRSVWVQDQSAVIEKGKITAYRVTIKLSFAVKR
jgi:flavin-binding protein dodecin